MKSLKFIFDFYRCNKLASIILFLVFTAAIFFSGFAFGEYQYITYSRDIFVKSGLQDSVYFMPGGFDEEAFTWEPLKYLSAVEKIQDDVKKFSAVNTIVSCPWFLHGQSDKDSNIYRDIYIFDQATYDAFSLPVSEGTNELHMDQEYTPEKEIEIVAYGYEYRDLEIGQTETLFFLDDTENQIKIKVVGKSDHELYLPNLGNGGSTLSAANFLLRGSYLVCVNSPALSEYLRNISIPITQEPFFIKIKPDATVQEWQNLLDYLEKNGYFLTYDDIMENTEQNLIDTMKSELPMPLFFLFVSSMALISISVLFVYKNIRKNSIYYICGCSAKKIFFYMACGIGFISILAGIINITIFSCMNQFIGLGIFHPDYSYYFDFWTVAFIGIYIAFILLISIGVPYLIYRKMSPIELYRRVQ